MVETRIYKKTDIENLINIYEHLIENLKYVGNF